MLLLLVLAATAPASAELQQLRTQGLQSASEEAATPPERQPSAVTDPTNASSAGAVLEAGAQVTSAAELPSVFDTDYLSSNLVSPGSSTLLQALNSNVTDNSSADGSTNTPSTAASAGSTGTGSSQDEKGGHSSRSSNNSSTSTRKNTALQIDALQEKVNSPAQQQPLHRQTAMQARPAAGERNSESAAVQDEAAVAEVPALRLRTQLDSQWLSPSPPSKEDSVLEAPEELLGDPDESLDEPYDAGPLASSIEGQLLCLQWNICNAALSLLLAYACSSKLQHVPAGVVFPTAAASVPRAPIRLPLGHGMHFTKSFPKIEDHLYSLSAVFQRDPSSVGHPQWGHLGGRRVLCYLGQAAQASSGVLHAFKCTYTTPSASMFAWLTATLSMISSFLDPLFSLTANCLSALYDITALAF
ncbi:uncharacterized protein LOC113147167 [Cyclospora cayetanensis]|uniref:Uncharacterized protein LOC113147167 n=1 Tax=Cyclospora cayetanensis TaxID=88456 RepID=A0A6P6RXD9_9EIME|nr:uncharacterized protein LOC113147167 [Cyclospora cayetanensis]